MWSAESEVFSKNSIDYSDQEFISFFSKSHSSHAKFSITESSGTEIS